MRATLAAAVVFGMLVLTFHFMVLPELRRQDRHWQSVASGSLLPAALAAGLYQLWHAAVTRDYVRLQNWTKLFFWLFVVCVVLTVLRYV
jgi:hypothetical protein